MFTFIVVVEQLHTSVWSMLMVSAYWRTFMVGDNKMKKPGINGNIIEQAGATKRWRSVRRSVKNTLIGLLLLTCIAPAQASAQSFLLSSYPGATVLLSVTKENGNYLGAALRVRRVSDNAQQDIPFNGKWADAASFNAFCAGTSCYMTTWYDQSGNSNNCVQATTSRQWQVIVDVDGNLSPQATTANEGCQIADSATYKTPKVHAFIVFRGGNNYGDQVLFGYMGTGADDNDTGPFPKSRFGVKWQSYDYLYSVTSRNGDGLYQQTPSHWMRARKAYIRAPRKYWSTDPVRLLMDINS